MVSAKYNGEIVWKVRSYFADRILRLLYFLKKNRYEQRRIIMDYKIWIASYFVSPPPYPIEVPEEKIESQACCWKTEETIWRHIGTVDSLEAARYLVENDRGSYKDSEGNVY